MASEESKLNNQETSDDKPALPTSSESSSYRNRPDCAGSESSQLPQMSTTTMSRAPAATSTSDNCSISLSRSRPRCRKAKSCAAPSSESASAAS